MRIMRYILFVLITLILTGYTFGEEVVSKEVPREFYIAKVNQIERLWVIPPDRRGFMGSRGITKFDYARPIRPEDRGEHYVVTWRYRGEELTGSLTLKFEYRTVLDPEEPYVEEYSWSGVKKGNYKWTFKNVGGHFSERGKVDRWKVSLIYGDKVVAEKRSSTWQAMEGN